MIVFWGCFAMILHCLLLCCSKHYNSYKTTESKAEYICYVNSTIHSALSAGLAVYAFYFTCEGWEQGATILNSPTCLANPQPIHYKIVFNTGSFLIYDLILFGLIVKASGPLAKQTFAHHILGSLSFYAVLFTGQVPVMYAIFGLFMELSNIFLFARWFFFEHGMADKPLVHLLNSACLFLTYLVFRVIFHSYISFTIAYPVTWEYFV